MYARTYIHIIKEFIMATIINNPDTGTHSSGSGMVFGILIAIIILAVFFIYALPSIRNAGSGTNINVPDRVDVNVNPTDGGNSGNQ